LNCCRRFCRLSRFGKAQSKGQVKVETGKQVFLENLPRDDELRFLCNFQLTGDYQKEICLNSIWLPLKMENKSSNKHKKTLEWRYLLPANEYACKQV
jgi:hypothetical protein